MLSRSHKAQHSDPTTCCCAGGWHGQNTSAPPPTPTDPNLDRKHCSPPLPQVLGSVPSVSLVSDSQGGGQTDVLSPLSGLRCPGKRPVRCSQPPLHFSPVPTFFWHSSLVKQETDKPQCLQTSVPLLALSNLRGAPSPLGPPGLVRNSTPPPTLPLPDWSVLPSSFKPISISRGW